MVCPSIVTELIPLLSLTLPEKVTVCDWEDVVKTTVLSSTPKLDIEGELSSIFTIVIVTLELDELPAVSVTTALSVTLLEPKL